MRPLPWIFLELFPIYKFCFHSQLKGYFIHEFCGITLLITVKQKTDVTFFMLTKVVFVRQHIRLAEF